MKKIFNLWLYELGKSKFMLGFLMIVFFVIQVLVHLIRILRIDPKNLNVEDTRSVTDLVQSRFGMNLALMAAFIIIIIASVYIWVKEFRSKGNFINRLFLLPGNRMQVYFAKFLTILSYILVLQITQFIILGVNKALLIWRFPVLVDQLHYTDFLNSGSMLQYLLPLNGTAYAWCMAFLMVVIVFFFQLAILEEGLKAYGWALMVASLVVYFTVCCLILTSYMQLMLHLSLTQTEQYFMTILYAVVFMGIHWLVDYYLLERKVSV